MYSKEVLFWPFLQTQITPNPYSSSSQRSGLGGRFVGVKTSMEESLLTSSSLSLTITIQSSILEKTKNTILKTGSKDYAKGTHIVRANGIIRLGSLF